MRIPTAIRAQFNIPDVRSLLLVLCGLTLPVGEGASHFLHFDVSKLFPVFAFFLIIYTVVFTKTNINYFPSFFNYFILFVIFHTAVVYAFVFIKGLFFVHENNGKTELISVMRFFLLIAFSYAIALNLKSIGDFKKITISYSIGFAVMTIIGITVSFFSGLTDAEDIRISGGFADPNAFATSAIMVVFFNSLLMVQKKVTGLRKKLCIFFILIGICAIVLSQSRAAFLACFAAVLYLVSKLPGVIKRTKIIFGSLALIVLSIIFLPASVKQSIMQKANIEQRIKSNRESRLLIWKDYLKQLPVYALQGLGRGRAEKAIEHSHTQWDIRWPHNHYLLMLVEFGIIGFLLFLASLWQIWKKIKIPAPVVQKWQIRNYLMPAFMLTMLVTLFFIDYVTLRDWWLFCGVAIAFYHWETGYEADLKT